MKLLIGIYNSFLWSLLIATILFNDTWLQMRVNIGYLFFACWLLLVIIWSLVMRHRTVNRWLTVINTVIVTVVALAVEGVTNLLVIPAAFIREGLHTENVSFTSINLVLVIIIIAGFLLSLKPLVRRR